MPEYEYRCPGCGEVFSAFRSMGRRDADIYHDCGPLNTLCMFPAKRVMSQPAETKSKWGDTPRYHGDKG